VLDDDPGFLCNGLASLILNGDPLHRQLNDVCHVHDVPGSSLQLDELEHTIEPVCAIQPRNEPPSARPESLLGVSDLCDSQLIGQTTLVSVFLSAAPPIKEK